MIKKFYADWCGPCRMMKPILKNIQETHGIEVIDIDTESEDGKAEAEQYGVTTLPTLVIYKDDTVVETLVGPVPEKILVAKLVTLGIV